MSGQVELSGVPLLALYDHSIVLLPHFALTHTDILRSMYMKLKTKRKRTILAFEKKNKKKNKNKTMVSMILALFASKHGMRKKSSGSLSAVGMKLLQTNRPTDGQTWS